MSNTQGESQPSWEEKLKELFLITAWKDVRDYDLPNYEKAKDLVLEVERETTERVRAETVDKIRRYFRINKMGRTKRDFYSSDEDYKLAQVQIEENRATIEALERMLDELSNKEETK